MPAKYVPTEEELKLIMSYYTEAGTYSEVSRRTGLSLPVVKRIVDENKTSYANKRVNCLIYDDTIPEELKENIKFNFNEEIEKFYKEVLLNGGIL
jgi:hypothetical protein